MAPFWPLEHTADLGLLVRSGDMAGLVVEASKGLVLSLVGEYTVRPTLWREVEVEAPDREVLLADFLSEILALAVVEALVAVKVDPTEVTDTRAKAMVGLLPLEKKQVLRAEIKAVTYHGLEIKEIDSGLEARVIMDV